MGNGRDSIEKMVREGDEYIKDTREMLRIMELAGEDISEETKIVDELSDRIERYREALKHA